MKNNLYIWGEIVWGNCQMKGEVPTLSHFLFWYIVLINGTMKEIKLTQGKVALVDDEDFEYLNQFKWCAFKGPFTYYAVKGKGPTTRMHRLIMKTATGMEVDHIDHNGLNNQRSNLRNCKHAQNQMNKRSSGTSKYLGVCLTGRGQIIATICIGRKLIYIGAFKTEESAAHAYDIEARKLFGEFANLNFKD
jgi:hypothetical protein